MIATLGFLKEKFEYYNNLIFQNELPIPAFELMKTKHTLGQFEKCLRLTPFGNGKQPKYYIRLSTYFDRPINDLCETVVHEMVHMWIAVNNIRDNGSHGKQWQKKANEINKKYGFTISRCSSVDNCDINPIFLKKLEAKPIMMFAYLKNNRWFTFATSVENSTKYKNWLNDSVKTRQCEKACYGLYYRNADFNYTLCRTRVHGFYKTIDEFFNEIYPNIKDIVKINF